MSRWSRFEGQIAGVGTDTGIRFVVGHWARTPMGAFSDVMVETASGHRVLLAPDERVAAFVESTYTFDEVRIEPVSVTAGDRWRVTSPSLDLELVVGRRTLLGRLLRLVPRGLATHPAWCTVTDPVARIVMGVRTRGTAREGRREFYGATDTHEVTAASGRFDDTVIGELRPVDPPCRFGFTSTPRRPTVTAVVTTVNQVDGAGTG